MTIAAIDPRRDAVGRDVRPSIPLPANGFSPAAIAVGFVVLGLALFMTLNGQRIARLEMARTPRPVTGSQFGFPAPPPLVVPDSFDVATPPLRSRPMPLVLRATVDRFPFVPPPARVITPSAPLDVPSQVGDTSPAQGLRLTEPALVYDATAGENIAAVGGAAAGDDGAVRATLIRNRASLMPQGTLIAAVLETPIDSTRPGLVRAIVSRDARSFDGSNILVPRGSRLIGEYRSDASPGQRRVLVTWTRLIRPDGVAIRIGSPATDALGGAGIAGRVNTHFFARFANAVLQSALSAGVNFASRSGSGTVVIGASGQFETAGQSLLADVPKGPTIKVRQGAEVMVFVARDLDFGGVGPVR